MGGLEPGTIIPRKPPTLRFGGIVPILLRTNFSNLARVNADEIREQLPEYNRMKLSNNDADFFKTPRKVQKVKWLGGLHNSYRWAA